MKQEVQTWFSSKEALTDEVYHILFKEHLKRLDADYLKKTLKNYLTQTYWQEIKVYK